MEPQQPAMALPQAHIAPFTVEDGTRPMLPTEESATLRAADPCYSDEHTQAESAAWFARYMEDHPQPDDSPAGRLKRIADASDIIAERCHLGPAERW
jgi:hypothetical protein